MSESSKPVPPSQADAGAAAPEAALGAVLSMLIKRGYLEMKQVRHAQRIQSKLPGERPLLAILKELHLIDDATLREALSRHPIQAPLGSLLMELGLLDREGLSAATRIQESGGEPQPRLGQVLVEHHFIPEHQLLQVLGYQLGYRFEEIEPAGIDKELFRKARSNWYRTHGFIPVRREEGGVLVVFADPLDRQALDAARNIFGNEMIVAIGRPSAIQDIIERFERGQSSETIVDADSETPVGIVNSMILTAMERDASDIHIEPMDDRLRIRFRHDGVLVHYKDYPLSIANGLTSRIKVMCEADITEKRRHQGGRIYFDHPEGMLDLRVSIYVTIHGESIVLRLLNRRQQLLQIADLGMYPRMFERFCEEALEPPAGVVIVTGPTGSGKTTTVYACINHLNEPHTKIISAEDPVEYVIEGISQCSVNPKINLTYEESLRHIVRQDPDIVVIGEIRDHFSAEVAVQAALTGHKVLTTFHTEDSIGGLIRLLNMDIEAFLISSTVVSVVAQRLLRRVCKNCAEREVPTAAQVRRLGCAPADLAGAEFLRGHGCPACGHSGYKGRVAIFELLVLNEAVREAILGRQSSHEIRDTSMEATGLVTLLEDGIVKAAEGVTSLAEVLRCLPRQRRPRPLAELQRLLGA